MNSLKTKTNHESPKGPQYDLPVLIPAFHGDSRGRRKHEKRIKEKGCFGLSFFRVFVIKNKIRHNSTFTFTPTSPLTKAGSSTRKGVFLAFCEFIQK